MCLLYLKTTNYFAVKTATAKHILFINIILKFVLLKLVKLFY
jgi:hypothetical protein